MTTKATTTATDNEPRLLSCTQVARRLSVSVRLVRQWITDGRLRAIKLSERVTRIPEEDVAKLVATSPPVKP
jgi:excisionase family DNA binding protein